MKYNPKESTVELNGIDFRVRKVLFQHKLWQNTEDFFRQAEQKFIERYNFMHGTDKTVLPITFMYVISKGGHRLRTSTLLEVMGYTGEKLSPNAPGYKAQVNKLVSDLSGIDGEGLVQTFAIRDQGVMDSINFVIVPCQDYFIGVVSMECTSGNN